MHRFSRRRSLALAVVAIMAIAVPMTVFAHGGSSGGRLRAEPWIFVGTAEQCGGPAGSRIVTSAWLGGMGLPDNGGDTALNATQNTRKDAHRGLLLSKNGPQADCSSAGATIYGVKGMVIDAGFALGFDYRNGGHCGAGAPRFNVTAKPPSSSTPEAFSFVGGCANETTPVPAPQDPQWTRVRFENPGEWFGPIPVGYRIVSIEIVFDEGTDISNAPGETPAGAAGLAVIDNIYIDGKYIRSGSGIEPGSGGRDDNDHGGKGDDD